MWLLAWNKTIAYLPYSLPAGFYALPWPRRGARISSLYSPPTKIPLGITENLSSMALYQYPTVSRFQQSFPSLCFLLFRSQGVRNIRLTHNYKKLSMQESSNGLNSYPQGPGVKNVRAPWGNLVGTTTWPLGFLGVRGALKTNCDETSA